MTTAKFNQVLTAQTKVFLSAIESDKKTDQQKMLAVYKTAEAMTKGAFTGIFADDGKKISASHPLYIFGQILSYCQKFVDAGKKDLLLAELKNDDGSFIGLRKAKEFLPALGRDNGMLEQFKPRNTGASHAQKTDKAEKQSEATTIDVASMNAETLGALSLAQLGALFDMVQSAMQAKMRGDATPNEKPTARKTATARKQATA